MAKLVARLLATAALWVRFQTYLKKYEMGDISKRVANTLYPAKKYTKKYIYSNEQSTVASDGFLIVTIRIQDLSIFGQISDDKGETFIHFAYLERTQSEVFL